MVLQTFSPIFFFSIVTHSVVSIAIIVLLGSRWHSASAYNSLSRTGWTCCSPTYSDVHWFFVHAYALSWSWSFSAEILETDVKIALSGTRTLLVIVSYSGPRGTSVSVSILYFLFTSPSYSILHFHPASLASLTVQTGKRTACSVNETRRWSWHILGESDQSSFLENRSNEWTMFK